MLRYPHVLIISVLFTFYNVSAISFNEVIDVFQVAKDVVVAVAKGWDLVDENFDINVGGGENGGVGLPFFKQKEKNLLAQINRINANVERLGKKIDPAGLAQISSMLRQLPNKILLDRRLDDLRLSFNKLNTAYRQMNLYANDSSKIERFTLERFAENAVSDGTTSVRSILENIHHLVAPEDQSLMQDSIFVLMADLLQVKLCVDDRT